MPCSRRVIALAVSGSLLSLLSQRTSAEVLFADNFEIVANGGNDTESTNAVAPLPELAADIGSYSVGNANGRVAAYGAALENPTPASPNNVAPSAFAGSGLHLLRLQPPTGGSRVSGLLAQPASVPGSAVRIEFDLYATSNINFGFGSQNRTPLEAGQTFGLSSPSKDRPKQSVQFNLVSAGGTINIFRDVDNDPSTANAQVATGLTYTLNTFQHIQIDYVLGSSELTLTAGTQTPVVINLPFLSALDSDFDGTTLPATPQSVSSISQVDAVFFGTGSAGSIGYVDNVVVTGTAFAGDANHDLKVTTLDFNALAGNFGMATPASWGEGDFNADNKVDSIDFALLVGNFGASISPPAAIGSTVPEPAALSALAMAGLFAARRRRLSRKCVR